MLPKTRMLRLSRVLVSGLASWNTYAIHPISSSRIFTVSYSTCWLSRKSGSSHPCARCDSMSSACTVPRPVVSASLPSKLTLPSTSQSHRPSPPSVVSCSSSARAAVNGDSPTPSSEVSACSTVISTSPERSSLRGVSSSSGSHD